MEWKEISRERVYDGYRKIDRIRYLLPDGKESDFDVVSSGEAVCALVISADEKVVLFKQFRPGPGKVLNELPGGGIELGEEPIHAIQREVLEETGYAGDVVFVGTAFKDAYSSCLQHNFVIQNAQRVQDVQHGEDEFGEVIIVTIEELKEVIKTGMLTDITTAMQALMYLGVMD